VALSYHRQKQCASNDLETILNTMLEDGYTYSKQFAAHGVPDSSLRAFKTFLGKTHGCVNI
jgi:hypothetical protein